MGIAFEPDPETTITNFDWDEDVVAEYYRIIHQTFPLLPNNKTRLKQRLAECPSTLREAFLAALDLSDYASTWVVLVMGLHFIPLAGSFGVPFLHVTAWACVAVAVAALLVGLLTDSSPHPWAAAGAGLALVLSSLATSSGVGPRSPAGAAAGIPAR